MNLSKNPDNVWNLSQRLHEPIPRAPAGRPAAVKHPCPL